MAQQTAVEWIIQWGKENPIAYQSDYYEAIEKAKAMEKEQIMDAYWNGTMHISKEEALSDAEKFYNEYYKK
ncbi:MAG: hypothetical protein ACRCW1_09180 [Anaerotignaceae bacterium]